MRVGFICRSALGGGAAQARYLLRHLQEQGHRAVMVSQREPARGFVDGTVHRLPLPLGGGRFRPIPWLATSALLGTGSAALFLRHRIHAFHAMEVAASGLAGLLAARMTPSVPILRFGGFLPSEVASHLRPPGWSPAEPMERTQGHPHPAIRLAALVQERYFETYEFILPTTGHAAGLLRRAGVPSEKIRVVPNGVDTHRFAPRPAPRLSPDFTLLAGGRFEPWKGMDLLLRALYRIRSEFPDVRLLLVGDGPEEPRLRALAAELGLDERVEFRRAVAHEALPDLLNGADGVAVPGYANIGVSNILQEAMACGKPVVASAIPGVAEFMEPGRSGLLFTPGDVEGLARGLRALAGDAELRRRLGVEARRLVAERFSMEAMVERVMEVHREAQALFEARFG